jgi:hypothetical protein
VENAKTCLPLTQAIDDINKAKQIVQAVEQLFEGGLKWMPFFMVNANGS